MSSEPISEPQKPATEKPAPPRKNHAWLWIFAALFLLAIAAMASIIAYNMAQQLKPEQLAAARALWKEHEPPDYEFRYTTRRTGTTEPDLFYVRVRQKQVVHVELNNRPLESRFFDSCSMSGLFSSIARFQKMDSEPERPRTFTRAIFAEKTGQLRWYVRRVMGSRERIEITVDEVKILNE